MSIDLWYMRLYARGWRLGQPCAISLQQIHEATSLDRGELLRTLPCHTHELLQPLIHGDEDPRYLSQPDRALALETCVLTFVARLADSGPPPWLLSDTYLGKSVYRLCMRLESCPYHALNQIERFRWPDARSFSDFLSNYDQTHSDRDVLTQDEQAGRRMLEILARGGVIGLFAVGMLTTLERVLTANTRATGIRQALRCDVALPLARVFEGRSYRAHQSLNRAPLCNSRRRIILSREWGTHAAEWRDAGGLETQLRRLASAAHK
jgi:hypothetical protein